MPLITARRREFGCLVIWFVTFIKLFVPLEIVQTLEDEWYTVIRVTALRFVRFSFVSSDIVTRTHAHTHMHTPTPTPTHAHTRTHMHTHTNTHTHTHTHTGFHREDHTVDEPTNIPGLEKNEDWVWLLCGSTVGGSRDVGCVGCVSLLTLY